MNDGPITERGDPRDRIHNQRPLFDVNRTTTAVCEACGAVREPDQAKANPCPFEEYDRVYLNTGRRAKRCLNRHDPAHAPFPEGF